MIGPVDNQNNRKKILSTDMMKIDSGKNMQLTSPTTLLMSALLISAVEFLRSF
jgi:hypothetical protein